MVCCPKSFHTIKIVGWILSKEFDMVSSNVAAQNFEAVISCLSYWNELFDKDFWCAESSLCSGKKKKKAVLAVCSYTDSGTSDNQARQYSIKQLSLTCTNLEGWMFLKHLFATSFGLATVLFPAGLVWYCYLFAQCGLSLGNTADVGQRQFVK